MTNLETCPCCSQKVSTNLSTIDVNRFIINQLEGDVYFCVNCLTYLGQDMPDGYSCYHCYDMYCDECFKKLKLHLDDEGILICPSCTIKSTEN